MKFWSGKLQKLKFKNLLEGFKDSFEQAEERIHKLKYRTMEIIKVEEQKEKKELKIEIYSRSKEEKVDVCINLK